MILVTGGLGFIGLHTARALLDLGQSCVLTQHQSARHPDFLNDFLDDQLGSRVFVEPLDLADQAAMLALGERYDITGVVHLAGPALGALGLIEGLRANTQYLLNVLQAAQDWQVTRVSVASAIGVYIGATDRCPMPESASLPMTGTHPIEAFKKSSEILSTLVATRAGFEVATLRIAAIWGPLGRPQSQFFPLPGMVHAAVNGEVADFSGPQQQFAHAEDGIDVCYVKDCGRGIALLQTAPKLRHSTYNVASGRPTTPGQVADAIRAVIPDAKINLPAGRDPNGSGEDIYLDITRLRDDTGYRPAYDLDRAVADYIGWLRAGNPR
jgi:UDP-glucose 4-epimerase